MDHRKKGGIGVALSPQYALSICSGIGGFDLALRIAFPHFVTALYLEREVAAAEVLVARMEEGSLHPAPIYSDLLTFDARPWRGVIHTVIAGLPCQPYSVAGKQLGHDDARAIWPAFIRVVGEMQPEVVFLENVPQFIRYFEPVGDALQDLGYCVAEPLFLTASEAGASHRRERFFALAHKPGACLAITTPGRRGVMRESSPGNGLSNGSNPRMGSTSEGATGDDLWFTITGEYPVADTRHGLFPLTWRGSSRRDGTRSAVTVLGDTTDYNRWRREPGEETGTGANGIGRCGSSVADSTLADTNGQRLQGFRPDSDSAGWQGPVDGSAGLCDGTEPVFAPGPGDGELWQELLVQHPELRPALSQAETEQLIHHLADGPASVLAGSRTDQLRACGNAVVPLQASIAMRILAQRAGLMGKPMGGPE